MRPSCFFHRGLCRAPTRPRGQAMRCGGATHREVSGRLGVIDSGHQNTGSDGRVECYFLLINGSRPTSCGGTADIQSLADLSNSFQPVQQMKVVGTSALRVGHNLGWTQWHTEMDKISTAG